MAEDVYQKLCETMAKRGGLYPGMDIPEFYELVQELFTPEEAAVCNAQPRGFSPASAVAAEMGKSEEEVAPILEAMADKGLCMAGKKGEITAYGCPPFVPGMFEFQFMRGTKTDRDRRIARVIHNYKEAVQAAGAGMSPITSPPSARIIPVDRKVEAENTVQTYEQVLAYIEEADPISVATCYCRHEALLLDEKDVCGMPMEKVEPDEREEVIQRYFDSPRHSAALLMFDDIINPKDTRPTLIDMMEILDKKRVVLPGKKHGNMPL